MAGLSFAAIDVETANSARGSICAVGVTVVRDGRRGETASWLCRPPAGLDFFSWHNIRVHGISAAMVADKPEFAQRWPEVESLVGELPVIAHNVGFDSSAIREACGRSGIRIPAWSYSCSLALARRHLSLDSYRLPHVAAALGIDFTNHHDAAADAAAAADIVIALAARAGVDSLAALQRIVVDRPLRADRASRKSAADRLIPVPGKHARQTSVSAGRTMEMSVSAGWPVEPPMTAGRTEAMSGPTRRDVAAPRAVGRAVEAPEAAGPTMETPGSAGRTLEVLGPSGRMSQTPVPAGRTESTAFSAVPRSRRSWFGREELVLPTVIGSDSSHPLRGEIVVFTGDLVAMTRQEAWDAIAACGATPARNITRRTTLLVIGDGFRGVDPDAFTTTKARRVAELRTRGQRIEVMDEAAFVACVGAGAGLSGGRGV
ncbi:exonuclease domain-containing protein [Nocardia sp. NPDC059228]|uniref:exonuclease domain-containing protein n=1 Tax=Nocardia sp. NPDC059228 TaxID=3346777 RepID=UPI0036B7A30B